MEKKTLADFRQALGSMVGFPIFADLPEDEQAAIDTIINAAYLECYADRNGRRPRWIEQYVPAVVKAPATATLTLTSGSTEVAGFAFETKYAGSFVKIGDRFFRYGGTVDAKSHLVQPWDGESGEHVATIYYNAVELPGSVLEVCEGPSVLGVGPLSPLPSPASELGLRSLPALDFTSRLGRSPVAFARPRFDTSLLMDVGDPIFFHIDQASTGPEFGISSRLHLYPIPGAVCTIEMRADILPKPLEAEEDTPNLPNSAAADIAGSVMMPIAFDLLLKHPIGRRYSGSNVQLIMLAANDARARLATFGKIQKRVIKTVGVARGW